MFMRRVVWLIAATLGLSAVGVATAAPQAQASTGGYPWYNATYVDANYDWGYSTCPSNDTNCMLFYGYNNGIKYGEADPWGYYLRNCTSFVAWKLTSQGVSACAVEGLGNGGDWYNNAPSSERSLSPKAGDAAVQLGTSSHPDGHVAYVDSVSGSNITVEEYNYAGDGTWDTRTGTPSALGFSEYVNFGLNIGGSGTLWGINTSGQAVRYAGNAHWTNQGGPAFKDIAATGTTVAAVSTTGAVYTYTGNNTWHMVSGATLADMAVQ